MQEVIDLTGFRYKECRADEWLPAESLTFLQIREKILNVKNSLNIIGCSGVYGNSWIEVLLYTFHDITIAGFYIQHYHINSGRHYIHNRFIAKTYHSLQELVLILYVIRVSQLERVFKLIYRNVEIFLRLNMIWQNLGAHKQWRYRTQQDSKHGQQRSCP